MAPPKIPADHLRALRASFDATLKDPLVLKDAEKLHLLVDPATGEQVERTLAKIASTITPAVKAKVAAILGWNKKKKKKKKKK